MRQMLCDQYYTHTPILNHRYRLVRALQSHIAVYGLAGDWKRTGKPVYAIVEVLADGITFMVIPQTNRPKCEKPKRPHYFPYVNPVLRAGRNSIGIEYLNPDCNHYTVGIEP